MWVVYKRQYALNDEAENFSSLSAPEEGWTPWTATMTPNEIQEPPA